MGGTAGTTANADTPNYLQQFLDENRRFQETMQQQFQSSVSSIRESFGPIRQQQEAEA